MSPIDRSFFHSEVTEAGSKVHLRKVRGGADEAKGVRDSGDYCREDVQEVVEFYVVVDDAKLGPTSSIPSLVFGDASGAGVDLWASHPSNKFFAFDALCFSLDDFLVSRVLYPDLAGGARFARGLEDLV